MPELSRKVRESRFWGRKMSRPHDYTEADLKRFSGHTSLRSLERYIADNREAAN